MNERHLAHYGVLGMKWGQHRSRSSGSSSKPKESKRYSTDAREVRDIQRKKVSQMSNAELKKVNNRKNLEQQYKNLNRGRISKGMKYVATAAGATGTILALYNNSQNLIKIGKKYVG